jgi:hypothetical protein
MTIHRGKIYDEKLTRYLLETQVFSHPYISIHFYIVVVACVCFNSLVHALCQVKDILCCTLD